MKPALIVNPRSGRGRAGRAWRRYEIEGETALTRGPGDAVELARRFADAGFDPVIAVGGDGTVNEVANGILASVGRPALGILPCGSAGDFARSLGIRRENAAAVLRAGPTREIDAARVVFANGSSRWFVNVASAGLGGEVARSRFGGYLTSALQALLTRGPWEISIDGEPATLLHAAIGNGQWQGGGMHVCPGADPSDGLLDITTIAPLGIWELARDLRMLYSGEIYRQAKVLHRRAAGLRLTAAGEVPFEMDGEAAGMLPVEIEVVPRVLRVVGQALSPVH